MATRKSIKLESHLNDQRKRQLQHLAKQKQRRNQKLEIFRDAPSPSNKLVKEEDFIDEMDIVKSKQLPQFKHELLLSEWMLEIPSDLKENWVCKPRPEGKRCLVKANVGVTTRVYLHNQRRFKFSSALPNGSQYHASGSKPTILDCIYVDHEKTFYILDVICWKGYYLLDCSTEMRYFWLSGKFSELKDALSRQIQNRNDYIFKLVPQYNCTEDGVLTAYQQTNFIQDGILFYNKESHYTLGLTPLCLLWKDSKVCRYWNEQLRKSLTMNLLVDENGNLKTLEDKVIDTSDEILKQYQVGDIVKAEIQLQYDQIVNVTVTQKTGRKFPDSFTRLMFHYYSNVKPITINNILSSLHEDVNDEEMI